MQNFNTLKNYIQRLFKDFQAPYLFSSISSALNYFSKIKDFQGFPKHAWSIHQLDSSSEVLYNLRTGSWLSRANDLPVHHASIHCSC